MHVVLLIFPDGIRIPTVNSKTCTRVIRIFAVARGRSALVHQLPYLNFESQVCLDDQETSVVAHSNFIPAAEAAGTLPCTAPSVEMFLRRPWDETDLKTLFPRPSMSGSARSTSLLDIKPPLCHKPQQMQVSFWVCVRVQ